MQLQRFEAYATRSRMIPILLNASRVERGSVGSCNPRMTEPASDLPLSRVPFFSSAGFPNSRSLMDRGYLNRRFPRTSWLIEVQPISFMPLSISARMRPSARSTPA
jgi:hypothetical protein